MNKRLILLCIPLLIACRRDPGNHPASGSSELVDAVRRNQDTALSISDKIKMENIKIGLDAPIAFESTDNIAIPLILTQRYLDKGLIENEYYNILVLSPDEPEGILVFENSGIIRKISTLEARSEIYVDNSYYNSDRKLYSNDFNSLLFIEKIVPAASDDMECVVLYVYDLSQKKLLQLSPDKYNLESWYPVDGKSLIVMSCKFDDNHDGKYNAQDDERIFMADFKKAVCSEKKFDRNKLKRVQLELKNTRSKNVSGKRSD